MNTFVSPDALPFLLELKKEKEGKINLIINNLHIIDVKEDGKFELVRNSIRNQVLLKPVHFEAPKFVNHRYYEGPDSIQMDFLGMESKHHYVHTIFFPFLGNSELFLYRPETDFTITSNNYYGLAQPKGNIIEIEVDINELNPEKAIVEAQNIMSFTFQIIQNNNNLIDSWSEIISKRIDNQLAMKRQELISLFS